MGNGQVTASGRIGGALGRVVSVSGLEAVASLRDLLGLLKLKQSLHYARIPGRSFDTQFIW